MESSKNFLSVYIVFTCMIFTYALQMKMRLIKIIKSFFLILFYNIFIIYDIRYTIYDKKIIYTEKCFII